MGVFCVDVNPKSYEIILCQNDAQVFYFFNSPFNIIICYFNKLFEQNFKHMEFRWALKRWFWMLVFAIYICFDVDCTLKRRQIGLFKTKIVYLISCMCFYKMKHCNEYWLFLTFSWGLTNTKLHFCSNYRSCWYFVFCTFWHWSR